MSRTLGIDSTLLLPMSNLPLNTTCVASGRINWSGLNVLQSKTILVTVGNGLPVFDELQAPPVTTV